MSAKFHSPKIHNAPYYSNSDKHLSYGVPSSCQYDIFNPIVDSHQKRSTKNIKYKLNRRPKRGKFKAINKSWVMFNCNAAGIKNRLRSFENIINIHFPLIWRFYVETASNHNSRHNAATN